MKRRFVFGVFVLSAIFAGSIFVDSVSAQSRSLASVGELSPEVNSIRVDDFTYAPGQLTDASGGANVSGGIWVTNTGTGNFLMVSAGSLSYTGYPSSGIGNKLDLISTAGSAEDTFRGFPTQTSGTTYAAFMVNITNTTGLALNTSTTGDYFAGFISSTSTTAFVNRVTIRAGSVAGTYQLGLRATGNAGNTQVFSTTDLPVGTTALVVISYQLVAGATNDVCNLWVNPVITNPEPAPTLSQVSASDNNDVGRFFFRQGNAGTPNASVDGVRVASSWAGLIALPAATVGDYNGDGKTDFAIVRNTGGGPSGQITWFEQNNGVAGTTTTPWGIASDQFNPGDFDGDGKTDIAVWRSGTPGNAFFYILKSSTGTFDAVAFGQIGDQPDVIGDYDGDGKWDCAIYRPGAIAGAHSFWWFLRSIDGVQIATEFGQNGDFPAPGDYNGDGKWDFVIQRNAGGGQASFQGRYGTGGSDPGGGLSFATIFGTPTDVIVPGDYDGDGKTDLAVVRGSGGLILWWIRPSGGGADFPTFFGNSATDFPTMGDYDGDGKTDISVWRPDIDPTQNNFYYLGSTSGAVQFEWGQNGDYPVANYNTH